MTGIFCCVVALHRCFSGFVGKIVVYSQKVLFELSKTWLLVKVWGNNGTRVHFGARCSPIVRSRGFVKLFVFSLLLVVIRRELKLVVFLVGFVDIIFNIYYFIL